MITLFANLSNLFYFTESSTNLNFTCCEKILLKTLIIFVIPIDIKLCNDLKNAPIYEFSK